MPSLTDPEELPKVELLRAARLLNPKAEEDEGRPKFKEAESIKLPDYPYPETYRSWRISVREIVRAASDRPDEAFKLVQEVYAKDANLKSMRETGKFLTLETKLLAALTRVPRGEISRQVLNFKETEATSGRAVRGQG